MFEAAQLLELSIVTVPANANALMRKLDAMVAGGAVNKTLAAEVAKMIEPSTRVVVPVGHIEAIPGGVKSNDERLTAIESTLADIKTTLGAELSALKGMLSSVNRGAEPQSAQVATHEEPKAPVATPSATRAAIYGAAMQAITEQAAAKGAATK